MKLRIESADNGWIVYDASEDRPCVFQTKEEWEDADYATLQDMLWHIASKLGPSHSKHNKKNIYICTIPGSSYEGELDIEYIEDLKRTKRTIGYSLGEE